MRCLQLKTSLSGYLIIIELAVSRKFVGVSVFCKELDVRDRARQQACHRHLVVSLGRSPLPLAVAVIVGSWFPVTRRR